jgi:hypothetical protein
MIVSLSCFGQDDSVAGVLLLVNIKNGGALAIENESVLLGNITNTSQLLDCKFLAILKKVNQLLI